MNRILVIATCMFLVCSVSGQSKKERKKNKIKSNTEWETIYENGKSNTYKCAYEEFDRDGHSTLAIEYGPDGAILNKLTSRYDNLKNKIEETEFDAAKKKSVRRIFKYNAFKDKTEEIEYNGSGAILKKTVFSYDANGNRSTETIYDDSGNLLKKILYKYNGKNLKTEKQTVSDKNVKLSGKKWEYEYY
jgi:hypothetical protein